VTVALLAGVSLLLALRHIPGSTSSTQTAPHAFRPGESYRALITARRFLAYTLAATGASAGFQLFSAGGAAVLVGGLGVTPEAFGYYAVLPPAGFLVGSFLAHRLTPRLGVDGMIACGGAVLVAAVALMLVLALARVVTPLAIIGPMVAVCCGSGLLTPNAVAGALSIKPEIGGTASGLLSFIQLGGAAGATFVLSRLDSHSAVALSGVIALCATAGIGAFAILTLSRTEGSDAASHPDLSLHARAFSLRRRSRHCL
jgi:DHA1 family bicyclomycin/chloramphenicol resistance-like MFS transporter